MSIVRNICNTLFTMMNNLINLTFYDASYKDIIRLRIDIPLPNIFSSTLLTLNIKVSDFMDCLYILDGRFNNLQSLDIDLMMIYPLLEQVENQVSLIIRDIFLYFSLIFLEKNSKSEMF